jgi:flagellar basal body rod protein FlgC
MDSVSSIASSGMSAAEQRLNIAAYNIANGNDSTPEGTSTFRPLRADQTATPGGGTAVTARVQFPNDAGTGVDFASEAIEAVTARYSFAANVAVMRSAAQMQQMLLDTFA